MSSKEKLLNYMQERAYKPLTFDDLCKELNIIDKKDIMRFHTVIDEMEKEGTVIKTRNAKYGIPEKMNLVVGYLQGNSNGFGFIIPDNRELADIFIPPGAINGAMDNDRVIARIKDKNGRSTEGEIIRILTRANKKIVGHYEGNNNFGFLIPDDKRIFQDIFIPKGLSQGAKSGHKVVAEVTRWPEKRRNPEGKIIEVLGAPDDPGLDINVLIRKFNFPLDFSQATKKELDSYEGIDKNDYNNREDLREETVITIDGADAKDLDDAVSLHKDEKGHYHLGVHIADVAHYVPEGSALDKDAYERATSVYLVDRVIPMFPPKLSNGLCSLNPQEDKLTMSVHMVVNNKGEVIKYNFSNSIINITERMTYDAVKKILLDDDEDLKTKYSNIYPMLQEMSELTKILQIKRKHRGAIDFNFPEVKIILDDEGKPIAIKRVERSIAEQLIEEFMLLCNETVASHFNKVEIPFLYRVHESPDEAKLTMFRDYINNLGYSLPGRIESIKPLTLQKILEQVAGKKDEKVVNTFLLRAMQQARYMAENSGHFGLAAKNYSHFTSPIRRYPDLTIHRILKEYLITNSITPKRKKKLAKKLPDIGLHCSLQERKAMEAERESQDIKKVDFMMDKIGETYNGLINGVTSFGLFVELANTIEGLVHISSLDDDYYHFNESKLSLRGEKTGKVYSIGDEVKVELIKVNKEEMQIDFRLLDMESSE